MERRVWEDRLGDSVVSCQVLGVLLEDLGGDRSARARFVRAFPRSALCRLQRLLRATESRQVDDAVVAVLSLRTSSVMVGAEALAEHLAGVERSIRLRDWADVGERSVGLHGLVLMTTRALEPFCDEVADAQ